MQRPTSSPYAQSIAGCLQDRIGDRGLSDAKLSDWFARVEPHWRTLQQDYREERLPLLRVWEAQTDIADASAAIKALSADAQTLVFFGTGGSSLGGQTLVQFADKSLPDDGPRIRFYSNLDAGTLGRSLSRLDLETTRFVFISKSGGTPETLVQAIAAIDAVRAAGLADRLPGLMLGLTEPAVPGRVNGLGQLLKTYGIPMLDHNPDVGGRYSVLTNVGLLPAIAAGLDAGALRSGAGQVIETMLSADRPADFAPASGAAVSIGLAQEKGIRNTVMMPYADRLERFSFWYAQLWAESLGKQGRGTTPVAALGPVDQHSQLQLFLDGPPDHMITLIRGQCQGEGPVLPSDLAEQAGAEWLKGHRPGDLVAAQQRAVQDALADAGRPVRTIDLDTLDETALGSLLMHFMIETILAARLLGVDPFDQPAVEKGKVLTRQYLGRQNGA